MSKTKQFREWCKQQNGPGKCGLITVCDIAEFFSGKGAYAKGRKILAELEAEGVVERNDDTVAPEDNDRWWNRKALGRRN